jgi:hypothetical protein
MRGEILGMPTWLVLLTLGGAGIVGYLIFVRGASASTSTPTTYSQQGLIAMANPDESATMAAQNQELSLMSQQLEGGFLGLGQQLSDTQTTLGDQLTGVSGQLASQQGQLTGITSAMSGQSAAEQAYYSSLLSSLQNYGNSIGSQLTNIGAWSQGAYNYAGAGYATAQQSQAQQQQDYTNLMNYLNSMQANLGGSIGTDKGELAQLASRLGYGQPIAQWLNQQGDYTVRVGQSGFGS